MAGQAALGDERRRARVALHDQAIARAAGQDVAVPGEGADARGMALQFVDLRMEWGGGLLDVGSWGSLHVFTECHQKYTKPHHTN